MKTEKEKMLSGELYDSADPELLALRRKARLLTKQFNDSADDEVEKRAQILQELIGKSGEGLWIEPPFYCDYGSNISMGDKVYFNFNCVVLDVCPVTFGSNVYVAPNVQFYAATHPIHWQERNTGLEFGAPIHIGSNVWIGGGSIICPGVRIGDGAVIGAGSVVTKDIPAGVVAVGNPCRVIRPI